MTTQDHRDRLALRTRGQAVRRALGLDEAHDTGAPGMRGLYDELIFGGVCSRPGLPQRDRLIATLAALAALERHSALKQYAKVAVTADVSAEAVREVILQAALHTGFVAGEENLAQVNAVLGEPDTQARGPVPTQTWMSWASR